jgi:hypothetical protein
MIRKEGQRVCQMRDDSFEHVLRLPSARRLRIAVTSDLCHADAGFADRGGTKWLWYLEGAPAALPQRSAVKRFAPVEVNLDFVSIRALQSALPN